MQHIAAVFGKYVKKLLPEMAIQGFNFLVEQMVLYGATMKMQLTRTKHEALTHQVSFVYPYS